MRWNNILFFLINLLCLLQLENHLFKSLINYVSYAFIVVVIDKKTDVRNGSDNAQLL